MSGDSRRMVWRHPAARMGVLSAAFFCALLVISELLYVFFPRHYLQWTPFLDRVWYAHVQACLVTGPGAPPLTADEQQAFEQVKQETKRRLVQDHPEAIIDGLLAMYQARHLGDPMPIKPDFVMARDSLLEVYEGIEFDLLHACVVDDANNRRLYVHLASLLDMNKKDPAYWRLSVLPHHLHLYPLCQPQDRVVQVALDLLSQELEDELLSAVEYTLSYWLYKFDVQDLGGIVLTRVPAGEQHKESLHFPMESVLRRLRVDAEDELIWQLLDHVDYCHGEAMRPVLDLLMSDASVCANIHSLEYLLRFGDDRVEQALVALWLQARGRDLQTVHGILLKQGRLGHRDVDLWRQALQRELSEADINYLLYRLELVPAKIRLTLRPQIHELTTSANELVARRAERLLQDL